MQALPSNRQNIVTADHPTIFLGPRQAIHNLPLRAFFRQIDSQCGHAACILIATGGVVHYTVTVFHAVPGQKFRLDAIEIQPSGQPLHIMFRAFRHGTRTDLIAKIAAVCNVLHVPNCVYILTVTMRDCIKQHRTFGDTRRISRGFDPRAFKEALEVPPRDILQSIQLALSCDECVQVHEAVCGSFSFPASGGHTDFRVWLYGRVVLSTSWMNRCQDTPLSRAFSNLIHDDTAILSGRRTSTMNVPAFTVARVGKPWSKAFHIGEVMLPDTDPALLTDRYIVGGKVIATPSRIAVCWVSAS
jgi:hypothetical protein